MCPDPALLVAYLDETLFHRDASAVDAHVATCASCTALLEAMRRVRAAEERSRSLRWRTAGVAIAVVALVSIGTWVLLRRSHGASTRETAPAPSEAVRSTAPTSAAASGARPAVDRSRASNTARSPAKSETPAVTDAKGVDRAADSIQIDGDVILRGRNANRRLIWRTRDRAIEHSIDGGGTWMVEHTADRPVRAGAFVDADVAWLVGENGLVLRRTKNGWFGASPPADGNISAVRASSPSKATVTFEDGRVFSTENGGVTWSPQ